MDNQRGVAISYTNIGLIYSDQKQFQKALTNYLEALASFKLLSDKKNLAHTYNIISSIYIRQQKTSEAEKALKEAQKLAKEVGLLEYLMNNYFYFHQLDSARNNYQGALNWHKQFVILKDSIFNKEKSKQITEMQTKYETEKKERENKLLKKGKALKESQIKAQEATIQRQNILTVGITLGALLLSFFALVFYRQRAHIRRLYGDIGHTTGNHLTLLMKMLESQKSKLQLHTEGALVLEELDATQQVLMNIASVYGDRKENDSRRGKHMINVIPHLKMLAETLRDTTQHQDYPVELIMDLPDEYKMTINQAIYLSMFTNEVIVNALKHAFEGHTSPQIRIQLTPNAKKHCQYIIQDNGVGFPVDFDENALDSEGFEQMKDFIKNLRAELVLDKKHQGVKYCLNF